MDGDETIARSAELASSASNEVLTYLGRGFVQGLLKVRKELQRSPVEDARSNTASHNASVFVDAAWL